MTITSTTANKDTPMTPATQSNFAGPTWPRSAFQAVGRQNNVAARAWVHGRFADADSEDLLLLDDLLGIADPEVALPQIDPDARRRRLTALLNTASRTERPGGLRRWRSASPG
jgi:hypothetical protein